MDFDEHEDQEEEMGIPSPPPPPGYDSVGNSGGRATKMGTGGGGGGGGGDATVCASAQTGRKGGPSGAIRYRDCLKNHAVGIGGQAVDGCCEFMAAGDDGTLDALKCAACGCHRNFHRKETSDGDQITRSYQHHHQSNYHHQFSTYYRAPPPPGYLHHLTTQPMMPYRPLALPAAASGGEHSREEEDMSNPSSSGGGGSGRGMKKRFRTKFTQEQREKMFAFAESLGWRIQRHDEGVVEQFCEENGVKRNVLKVWMHNNKHTLGKKP
ncbi:Zinc-finger homeodomain protein [Quillaja saponaria]|uniref:Zinc-finger homeodomain protein n=1 Tax=Quillaja saponaria TaxID=32244 RepID=A0AAD7LKY5_QUISA|nr:Zinc-finger homeodomain protein [Quillaja saponaria]